MPHEYVTAYRWRAVRAHGLGRLLPWRREWWVEVYFDDQTLPEERRWRYVWSCTFEHSAESRAERLSSCLLCGSHALWSEVNKFNRKLSERE